MREVGLFGGGPDSTGNATGNVWALGRLAQELRLTRRPARHRLFGLISHIHELRERLSARITVVKRPRRRLLTPTSVEPSTR
jgi:hypothetical protein